MINMPMRDKIAVLENAKHNFVGKRCRMNKAGHNNESKPITNIITLTDEQAASREMSKEQSISKYTQYSYDTENIWNNPILYD